MPRQVAGIGKALATGRTHIGFFAQVGLGMPRQGAGHGKALATSRAHVGFLARVGPSMLCQGAGLSYGLGRLVKHQVSKLPSLRMDLDLTSCRGQVFIGHHLTRSRSQVFVCTLNMTGRSRNRLPGCQVSTRLRDLTRPQSQVFLHFQCDWPVSKSPAKLPSLRHVSET